MTAGSGKLRLNWPPETARVSAPDDPSLCHFGSNICLDLHGNPLAAGLVIFSDGNHHMALCECAGSFLSTHPDVADVFYATTPPGLLLKALQQEILHVGNLALSVSPDVFIGPREMLDELVASGAMKSHFPFAESRGNVLLVRRGNPKNIRGVADLLRDDIRIALSNPVSENASFKVYFDSLMGVAAEAGLDVDRLRKRLNGAPEEPVIFSSVIHHRELPQLLAEDRADVAVVYYHLALRYQRVFPDIFEFVSLSGNWDNSDACHGQRITRYHLGLIGDGGAWGQRFLEFMRGAAAGDIYRNHGLNPVGSSGA